MEIIIPAAGLSSRFPNMRPKYTLVDYSGQMMLKRAVNPFLGKYNITIGILQTHNEKYDISSLLKYHFKQDINIMVLEQETTGPADTVKQIIDKANLSLDSEIFIKDCDSFFNHSYFEGNYVCISKLSSNKIIKNPGSKSYIISNDQGIIQNIIEKNIVSEKFCVGGYKFENSRMFIDAFDRINKNNKEIYVSDIIQYCLSNNRTFLENIVTDYTDVGTAEDWFTYNDKAVIFCDIDGTLIQAQAKHHYHQPAIPLPENVTKLQQLLADGNQIIFVTARPQSAEEYTRKMLNDLGFNNCQLIMNLLNCKRILINDFNTANPYPRAIGVNIQRNSDTLKEFI
jgi:choline kinase